MLPFFKKFRQITVFHFHCLLQKQNSWNEMVYASFYILSFFLQKIRQTRNHSLSSTSFSSTKKNREMKYSNLMLSIFFLFFLQKFRQITFIYIFSSAKKNRKKKWSISSVFLLSFLFLSKHIHFSLLSLHKSRKMKG